MNTTPFSKLEETFELESITDAISDSDVPAIDDDELTEEVITNALSHAELIDEQFRQFRGRDAHDREMDEIAELAIQAHRDLRDLGMSVEIRHAGEIFSSSGQMLKIGLEAKNSKVDKKLKLLKLQLDKMRLENQSPAKHDNAIDGDATLIDRNELLAQVRKELSEIDNDNK